MDLAAEGGSSSEVFYRWVDYLDHPIDAREFRRGDDVVILYEDSDGRWHVEDVSNHAQAIPRRLFADEEKAQAHLQSEGFAFVRTVPFFQRPRTGGASGGWPAWLGWTLFAVLVVVLCGVVAYVIWSMNGPGSAYPALPSE